MHTNDALILQFMPLANKLAYKKKKTLPRNIDIEDLRSAAYLGLVEAASRYDASLGYAFSTYAYPRIFGAINDYLRSLGSLVTNFDDEKTGKTLETVIIAKEEVVVVEDSFEIITNRLSAEAKNILKLYFADDLTMKEVGRCYKISESRVSQLLTSYKKDIKLSYEAA